MILASIGCHLGRHVEYIKTSKLMSYMQDSAKKKKKKKMKKKKKKKKYILNDSSGQICFLQLIGCYLGCHLKYIKIPNDDRVASVEIFKGNL